MKVLLSAYACEPGKGSEPEVGYRALLAAASKHDVWILTRANNLSSLEPVLRDHPLAPRIHVEAFDIPGSSMRAKHWGLPMLHWYYDIWQRRAWMKAQELEGAVGFDVVHHATFAAYWTRVGVAGIKKPFVWGPIGGGVGLPKGFVRTLGARGLVEDSIRYSARGILGRSPWIASAAQNASVVLVQNQEAARALPSTRAEVLTLPNATSAVIDSGTLLGARSRNRDVIFIGRLVAWKGASLAIRAMARIHDLTTRLRIYGSGPDRSRLGRLARSLGLEHRVEFMGPTLREELLVSVAEAGCVIYPSLHDDSPLGVAEALTLGAPLVCLDHGGPAELIRLWPASPARAVTPQSLKQTVASLAIAVKAFLDDPPPIPVELLRPERSFHTEILDAYERAVSGYPDRVNQALEGR